MPTGGSIPKVMTLAEREALRQKNGSASPLVGVRHPMAESKPAGFSMLGDAVKTAPSASTPPAPPQQPPAPKPAASAAPAAACGTFKIERGIPVPEAVGRGRKSPYPFEEMAIGDSFFVPGKDGQKINLTGARKKTGFTFTKRTVSGGARVWRIA